MAISYDTTTKQWNVTYEKTDYRTDYPTDVQKIVDYKTTTVFIKGVPTSTKTAVYGPDTATNERNAQLNAENQALNELNAQKNQIYDLTVSTASRTLGGDYTTQRDSILNQINAAGLGETFTSLINTSFRNFYATEKLQTWDANLGAKPPYGTFDYAFYKQQSPDLAAQWQEAVDADDLDIIGRYNENTFYLWHYTTQGKEIGLRANPTEELNASESYVEYRPTDADIQAARNMQLGIDTGTQTERLLSVPEIGQEWEKAKNNDPYWTQLGKQYSLDPTKADEFAALFRLSDRPEDKQISFQYNANAGYGITELEDAVNSAVGEKATIDVKRFGALAQDVLKETIAKMKEAKAKEQFLSTLQGLPGFNEVMNFNKEISNSMLGDTGIGGILAFTSGNKATESFEKGISNITGLNNNTSYNWQAWFDNELKKKYEQDIELGFTQEGATENVKIQSEFAKEFIDKYLTPRFNSSKSMNEFIEYLDVSKQEQNPFQTQDMLNAVSMVANLRAEQYLQQVQNTPDRYFNTDFYFNPYGNKAAEERYGIQSQTVASDWEAAKNGDAYWAQQAYRFGVDVNNKEEFARMHYQVKGRAQGYDPAQDILTASNIQDEIYGRILPALKEEALKQGTVFGQFITPEEFADSVLKNIDPGDKSTWGAVLKPYGLTSFEGTYQDLRNFVAGTLRTSSAEDIRQQIKILNELKERPRQELLGSSYIERPTDFTSTSITPKTELYKVFQSAGYQGTEDEFYKNFFPDLDPADQKLFQQTKDSDTLGLTKDSFSDPFKSLSSMEGFFGEEKTDTENMFNLNLNDESTTYKSKSGNEILDEFTSGFSLF